MGTCSCSKGTTQTDPASPKSQRRPASLPSGVETGVTHGAMPGNVSNPWAYDNPEERAAIRTSISRRGDHNPGTEHDDPELDHHRDSRTVASAHRGSSSNTRRDTDETKSSRKTADSHATTVASKDSGPSSSDVLSRRSSVLSKRSTGTALPGFVQEEQVREETKEEKVIANEPKDGVVNANDWNHAPPRVSSDQRVSLRNAGAEENSVPDGMRTPSLVRNASASDSRDGVVNTKDCTQAPPRVPSNQRVSLRNAGAEENSVPDVLRSPSYVGKASASDSRGTSASSPNSKPKSAEAERRGLGRKNSDSATQADQDGNVESEPTPSHASQNKESQHAPQPRARALVAGAPSHDSHDEPASLQPHPPVSSPLQPHPPAFH